MTKIVKVYFSKGKLIAEASNIGDVQALLELGGASISNGHKGTRDFSLGENPKKRKPEKRRYKRVCERCLRTFKGKKGLGVHMFKAHGIGKKTPVELLPGVTLESNDNG